MMYDGELDKMRPGPISFFVDAAKNKARMVSYASWTAKDWPTE
jgi:hypothetical protein